MERVGSVPVYQGVRVDVRRDTVRTLSGRERPLDVVEHPGGVVVIAEQDGALLLVRQYRYPIDQALLELPAGTREPGEDPLVTADRELQEEAGVAAGRLTKIGEFYTAPGFCTELLHVYVAEELRPSQATCDDDEEITVERHTFDEALAMARTGAIRDAKTIAALLLYQGRR